jgi:hypothetical protein
MITPPGRAGKQEIGPGADPDFARDFSWSRLVE